MRPAEYHTPVLLDEVLSFLLTNTDGVYVDATLGGGGHAEALAQRLSPAGRLIGIDFDPDARQFAAERLKRFGEQVIIVDENFRNCRSVLARLGFTMVSGFLFDLGVSSRQFDDPARGFSFRSDERLDMRMDRHSRFEGAGLDAREIVNRFSERELEELLWKYGEERHSRRIARAIVRQRAQRSIETTGELRSVVRNVVGDRFLQKSLARVFQALRIAVNNELENLRQALGDAIELLEQGGRIVVVSYHSLEDRIVKETFRAAALASLPSGNKLIPDTARRPILKILTRKPVTASKTEIRQNPRARSAKLRASEKA